MSQGKKKVVVVSLVTALCLLGDSMLYVVLPIYWIEAGLLSLWEVGLILSFNRFVRLPLNPLIGWLYTKLSLRTGLIIAVSLATLTSIGYGLAAGLWLWLLLRCLWGFAWSLLRLGGFFTVITYADDRNRGYLMGLYNGLYRLGSLVGMLVGGVLASLLGLTFVSFLFGLCSFLGIFLVLWAVEPSLVTEEAEHSTPGLGQINWLEAKVLKIIISGFILALLIQGVFTSTLSYLLAYLFTEYVPVFGLMIGVAALSGILQGVRWTWEPFLAAKIGYWSDGPGGRLPLFRRALLISGICYVLLPWSMSIYLWLVCGLITMLSATALTTLNDALAADVAKTRHTIAIMTIYSIALDFGAAVGPLLAYLVLEFDAGVVYTYVFSALLFLLLALIWYPVSKGNILSKKESNGF